jgi:hypothetical protein
LTEPKRRPVDEAMAGERPEKVTMRQLWFEAITAVTEELGDEPLYLTLSGSEGKDIELLIKNDVVHVTETGAIAESDQGLVVAVQSNRAAYASLRLKYPGLRALNKTVSDLLAGESAVRYPTGREYPTTRARVVNLDFNQTLRAQITTSGLLNFPQLAWVTKLAQLHAHPTPLDWKLCLTFKAEIGWPDDICSQMAAFFSENVNRSEQFAAHLQALLGPSLVERLQSGNQLGFSALAEADQQRILMAMVPKRISQAVHNQGWRLSTTLNVRYGGGGGSAAMSSWIVDFIWDARSYTTPDAVYLDSLMGVIANPQFIDVDGERRRDGQ